MSMEQQLGDPTLTRRSFMAGAAGMLGAVLFPHPADAQGPPQSTTTTTAPDQTPTTLDPVQKAKLEKLQAEIDSLNNKGSWLDTASDLAVPLAAGGSVIAGLVEWRKQRMEHTARNASEAESRIYDQQTKIIELLHSDRQTDLNQGAERLLMMASSDSLEVQDQVFMLARGALRRREAPEDGLVRLGDYEKNITEAFFAVLPGVRKLGRQYKEAFVGPDETAEPSIDAEGINLSGVKLVGWDLSNMHMSRGTFRYTRLQNCKLRYANFNGCDMRDAIFMHMSGVNDGDNFKKIWFQNTDLRGAIFRTRYLNDPDLYKQVAVMAADITGLILLGDPIDKKDPDPESEPFLTEERIKALEDRGAIYVPKTGNRQQYREIYNRTRTPVPPSLET